MKETLDEHGFHSDAQELFETITQTVNGLFEKKTLEESKAATAANEHNNKSFFSN